MNTTGYIKHMMGCISIESFKGRAGAGGGEGTIGSHAGSMKIILFLKHVSGPQKLKRKIGLNIYTGHLNILGIIHDCRLIDIMSDR